MGDAINITVTGLVIVFLALAFLILVMYIQGAIVNFLQKPKKTKVAENTAPITTNIETKPSSEIQNPDEVSGEVIAAISAAIAYMGGGKILSVKKAERKKAMGRSAWATAGLLKNTNRN